MIATIHSVVSEVLSQANEDQNQHYPPRIITSHFRMVTNAILDQGRKQWPGNADIVDILSPFLETVDLQVKNGVVELPKNCRHALGLTIFISDNGKPCENLTPEEIEQSRLEARMESRDIKLKEQFEYNRLTTHKYKKPTALEPIGAVFNNKEIRINPFNVGMVQLSYLRYPKEYFYGYKTNPDDTYFWDENSTVESEWTNPASGILFTGMNILYSNYARDTEQTANAQALRLQGLL